MNHIPTLPDALRTMSICAIADLVRKDWTNVYFGAVPYLAAMRTMLRVEDSYGLDDGKGIVTYFLCNAQTWKGDTARAVKAELKRRIK